MAGYLTENSQELNNQVLFSVIPKFINSHKKYPAQIINPVKFAIQVPFKYPINSFFYIIDKNSLLNCMILNA